MGEAEARMILNVKPKATEEEVAAAAESLLKMNDPEKGGSEYLQYKIRNARDSIVVPPPEGAAQAGATQEGRQLSMRVGPSHSSFRVLLRGLSSAARGAILRLAIVRLCRC